MLDRNAPSGGRCCGSHLMNPFEGGVVVAFGMLQGRQWLIAQNAFDPACESQQRSIAAQRRVELQPDRKSSPRQANGKTDARKPHAACRHGVIRQGQGDSPPAQRWRRFSAVRSKVPCWASWAARSLPRAARGTPCRGVAEFPDGWQRARSDRPRREIAPPPSARAMCPTRPEGRASSCDKSPRMLWGPCVDGETRRSSSPSREKDAPCGGLDERAVVVAQIYLQNLGSGLSQLTHHISEARLDFRIDELQKLSWSVGQANPLQVVSAPRVARRRVHR